MVVGVIDQWFLRTHGRHPGYGDVKVGTLDNPGWQLLVLLPDSPPDREIMRCDANDPGDTWVNVRVRGGIFEAHSGPRQLGQLIRHLLAYPGLPDDARATEDWIERLIEWYMSRCDGDWENEGGVEIIPRGDNWRLSIDHYYWPVPQYTAPPGTSLRRVSNVVEVEGSFHSLTEFIVQLRPLPPGTEPQS